ncbi:C-factor [Roseovarius albus]|uniref:C-factor n=1 Tax=Roseovarius albus TaxID=1247867 RepID=A0A1X6YIP1_9RHOB|nr:SDR family NAD(P)-dependent oxidoreductase [Roseovarius albus]SLN22501.1 C-factor [Roseovarius albus]
MKTALVIGASGGIGAAATKVLATKDVIVTELSRSVDGFDICDEQVVVERLGRFGAPFDLILVATGALEIEGSEPEKTLRQVNAHDMTKQFMLNSVGPSLVLKHAIRLLPKDRRSVFAALSARVGSIGDNRLGGWYSYRTAKAALNQMIHTGAIELARSHKEAICVALHPGTVDTAFTQKYVGRYPAVPPERAAQNLLSVIDDLKIEDSGGFFDWKGDAVPW